MASTREYHQRVPGWGDGKTQDRMRVHVDPNEFPKAIRLVNRQLATLQAGEKVTTVRRIGEGGGVVFLGLIAELKPFGFASTHQEGLNLLAGVGYRQDLRVGL